MTMKLLAILATGLTLGCAALAPARAASAPAPDPAQAAAAPAPDWSETDLVLSKVLATGHYEIKASYRTYIQDVPITVYLLQDPANRKDVLECYSDDGFTTSRKCMRPDGGKR